MINGFLLKINKLTTYDYYYIF